jgi:hypothetical protein
MTLTIRQIMESGRWEEFCAIRGWDPGIVIEGRVDSAEEVELDDAEIQIMLGITKGDAE